MWEDTFNLFFVFFCTTCGNTFCRTACGKVRRHYLSEMNKINRIYHTVIDKLSFFVIHLFYIDSEVIKKNMYATALV